MHKKILIHWYIPQLDGPSFDAVSSNTSSSAETCLHNLPFKCNDKNVDAYFKYLFSNTTKVIHRFRLNCWYYYCSEMRQLPLSTQLAWAGNIRNSSNLYEHTKWQISLCFLGLRSVSSLFWSALSNQDQVLSWQMQIITLTLQVALAICDNWGRISVE